MVEENMAHTLTKAQTAKAEEIGRELAKTLTPHWTGVTQKFLDTQAEMNRKHEPIIALASTTFALEVHLAAVIGSLGRENARFIAQRVLERVENQER